MPELSDPEIYQSVLENLETGVYIVDRNRRICFWNDGAEQITGYLRQDVVGHFLRDHLLITGGAARDASSVNKSDFAALLKKRPIARNVDSDRFCSRLREPCE
jgi:PAS domain S-box-containing protein